MGGNKLPDRLSPFFLAFISFFAGIAYAKPSARPTPVPTIIPTRSIAPAFGVAPSLSCYTGFIGANVSINANPIAFQPAGLSFATYSCVSYCQYCKHANDTGFFSCHVGSTVLAFQALATKNITNLQHNSQVSDLQICNTADCNSPSSFTGSCKISSSSSGTNRYVADGAAVIGVCIAIIFLIICGSVVLRRRHFQLASQSAAENKAQRGQTDVIPVPSPLRGKTAEAIPSSAAGRRLQPDQRDQDL